MSRYDAPLAETATRALEELCFFFVRPELTDAQREAPIDGAMEVRFHGPLDGRLVVRLCGGTLAALASNMLGDTTDSHALQRDALGEVANVICGHLLPVIGGSDAVYLIDAAQPAVVVRGSDAQLRAEVRLGLEEDGRADLLLYIHAAERAA
jgi:chemotaxis protein CheX